MMTLKCPKFDLLDKKRPLHFNKEFVIPNIIGLGILIVLVDNQNPRKDSAFTDSPEILDLSYMTPIFNASKIGG